MSSKQFVKFDEMGLGARQLLNCLSRSLLSDPVAGGLRVETATTLSVLTTQENLDAAAPRLADSVIEEGQVDPLIDPLRGLAIVYEAKTHDFDHINYALSVGMRIL